MRRICAILLLACCAAAPSERELVKEQMRLRPSDPWPRGAGHVVLAAPNSLLAEKAYLEPGGSFSPAVGSFGISVWLPDGSTSDSIPLDQVQQSFTWSPRFGVVTETPAYRIVWTAAWDGGWDMTLKGRRGRPVAVVRSVGPAGGPVTELRVSHGVLLVNGRWQLMASDARVYLGEECTPGWRTERSGERAWRGASGWGYARILSAGHELSLHVHDISASAPIVKAAELRSKWRLDLPDRRFTDCLNAQVAHLMMGLVEDEPHPGDPVEYSLAWLREGAYTLAALARAGQADAARELALYVARNDFFGGFGAEADGPGLALWALAETAARLQDAAFESLIWPDIERKAGLVLEMLEARRPVRHAFSGAALPQFTPADDFTLVAEPARGGLIVGRVDHQHPLLFVNAVSYLGLREAAAVADRTGHEDEAARWRARAEALQHAWVSGLLPAAENNPRTWISGLWPSWVAAPARARYRQGLEIATAREFRQPPLWTYFDLAEAHQWLYLAEPQRAWKALEWFWDHQASPGLYTWWEGDGEPRPGPGLWDNVRGWVNPPNVTPHYWTAAEMLLLQADMLEYVDRSGPAPVLVIGAGVPAAWLRSRLRVAGDLAEWTWDGRRLRVKRSPRNLAVRAGPAFPAGALAPAESSRPRAAPVHYD